MLYNNSGDDYSQRDRSSIPKTSQEQSNQGHNRTTGQVIRNDDGNDEENDGQQCTTADDTTS
jgi:hypothetical protein